MINIQLTTDLSVWNVWLLITLVMLIQISFLKNSIENPAEQESHYFRDYEIHLIGWLETDLDHLVNMMRHIPSRSGLAFFEEWLLMRNLC